jgi:hypothetical protein
MFLPLRQDNIGSAARMAGGEIILREGAGRLA